LESFAVVSYSDAHAFGGGRAVIAANQSLQPAPPAVVWWNDDHPVRTRLFDAISLMLPSAEQFLIDTMLDWQKLHEKSDPKLQAEVRRLCTEEKTHQRAHSLYNSRMHQQGLPAKLLESRVKSFIGELYKLPLEKRILLSAAFEHLTAVFSLEVISNDHWLTKKSVAIESRLWRWHCREEIDHCHVALDLVLSRDLPSVDFFKAFFYAGFFLFIDTIFLTAALCGSDVRRGLTTRKLLWLKVISFAVRSLPSVLRMAWHGSKFCFLARKR
jgi:predicted metal-dependent hydrolase